jgi:hypothetical protein
MSTLPAARPVRSTEPAPRVEAVHHAHGRTVEYDTKDTRVGEFVAPEEFSRGISFMEPVDWSELQTAIGGEA